MAEKTGKNEFADVLEGKRPRQRRTEAEAKAGPGGKAADDPPGR